MPRTPTAPLVDVDDYGFDVVGNDFTSTAQQRVALLGLDSLARDLFYTCLCPFTNKAGDVIPASYYRFLQLLTPAKNTTGGPRFKAPTKDQLRGALERLQAFGLVRLFPKDSMRDGVLKIRVVRRFGDPSSRSVSPGVSPGSKKRRKRANTPMSA